MKIKQKIRLGIGLIFIVVLFFGIVSIYFVSQLSNSSKVILKNNYETLSFTREMRTVLDDNKLPLSVAAKTAFNTQLIKQEHNITEKGEREATAKVRSAFTVLQAGVGPLAQQEAAEHEARLALRTIEGLNMQAVVAKTAAAEASVNRAVLVLGIVCCFTFLLLFSFSVNISAFVADPLIKLREAFGEISRKNYDHRIGFGNNLEFEELTGAFNQMAERLKERDNLDIAGVLTEKRRIETIIEHTNDAIIITDEQQLIVFINKAAQDLFHLNEAKLIGKSSWQLAASNRKLKHVLENEGGKGSFKFDADGKEMLYQLEAIDIFVPNIATIRPDELNIARNPAGKIYMLKNIGEMHEA
jgi:nitrogen fixation/metabolism regulation signal transduction histidine kinase